MDGRLIVGGVEHVTADKLLSVEAIEQILCHEAPPGVATMPLLIPWQGRIRSTEIIKRNIGQLRLRPLLSSSIFIRSEAAEAEHTTVEPASTGPYRVALVPRSS